MAKNPHFRLLALTATPGSTPEAVQAVVDSLHISHVEIRDEESLDLRRYMHEKRVEQHVLSMNENIMKIADLMAAIMQVSSILRFIASGIICSSYSLSLNSCKGTTSFVDMLTRRLFILTAVKQQPGS